MPKFNVRVTRSIETTVEDVEAPTAEAAADLVMASAYPLPSVQEWDALKDWRVIITDDNGDEVFENDR